MNGASASSIRNRINRPGVNPVETPTARPSAGLASALSGDQLLDNRSGFPRTFEPVLRELAYRNQGPLRGKGQSVESKKMDKLGIFQLNAMDSETEYELQAPGRAINTVI